MQHWRKDSMKRLAIFLIILMAILSALVVILLAGFYQPAEAAAPEVMSTQVVFEEATPLPANLDELYALIEGHHPRWTFTPCKGNIPLPFFGWQQVYLIERLAKDDGNTGRLIIDNADLSKIVAVGGIDYPKTGTLVVDENRLFAYGVLMVYEGQTLICSVDGLPVVYGEGVQVVFDRIAGRVE